MLAKKSVEVHHNCSRPEPDPAYPCYLWHRAQKWLKTKQGYHFNHFNDLKLHFYLQRTEISIEL